MIEQKSVLKNKYYSLKSLSIFLLAISAFYVQNEPSPFEFIALSIMLFDYKSFSVKDFKLFFFIFFLLNISTFFSEEPVKSIFYNSVTLFLVMIGVYFYRLKVSHIKVFIVGSFFGLLSNVLITLFFPDLMNTWFFSRYRGGFKDPNVLGPALLYLIIITHEFKRYANLNKLHVILLTIFFSSVIIIGQSRITILLLLIYFAYLFRKKIVVFSFITLILILINFSFIEFINLDLSLIYENYFGDRDDSDRFLAQISSVKLTTFFGLGATSSGSIIGHDVHNTVLLLISDYGLFTFFIITICLVYNTLVYSKILTKKIVFFLFLVFVNAMVVDVLHWRHMYIFIALVFVLAKLDFANRQSQIKNIFNNEA